MIPPLPPADPAERVLWVRARLKEHGTTIAALSRACGWSESAIARALRSPSLPQEQALARRLGLTVQQMFPERYDAATGERLHLAGTPYAARRPHASGRRVSAQAA